MKIMINLKMHQPILSMLNRLPVISIIYAVLLINVLGCTSSERVGNNKEFSIGNIIVDKQSDQIVVYYDLHCSEPGTDFKVNLFMEIDKGEYYHVNGGNTSGELGENITPGARKQIVWNISRDFPFGLETNEVKFVVQAIPEKEE